ncbi:MAG: type I-E CRISPR-associated protein Cse1/CasA [Oscillospiraceae bacterium]|nr:type I-E CRISPR-associated protein Cse1/CasA [Oscillospiraceae bacterium]
MKEFNLLREKWILVMTLNGKTEALSLIEIFRRASELRALAGELPTQDIAVLRLLLAILHAALGGRDIDGNELPDNEDDKIDGAFALWGALWDRGAFPCERIERYLEKYEERFWLFHDETPFYQAKVVDMIDEVFGPFPVSKLIGELAESENKPRLFPPRSGDGKVSITYAEAARWLIYFVAYAESFGKLEQHGKKHGDPGTAGTGWLGKFGQIYATGDNFFETLVLNFVLLDNGSPWNEEKPAWLEQRTREHRSIRTPDNLSELYTLQSRLVLLKQQNGHVVSYRFVSGDFCSPVNAFVEPMAAWYHSNKDKKNAPPEYSPRRHHASRQLWRDYSALIAPIDGARRPGVISWLAYLKDQGTLDKAVISFGTTGIKYGSMQAAVTDTFADSLTFNMALLVRLDGGQEGWGYRIIDELEVTEKWAYAVGELAAKIAKASGGDGAGERDSAREQAYFRLDMPFRRWLESIDPKQDDMDNKSYEWRETAQRIVRRLGEELFSAAGMKAFVGRGENSSPRAYGYFLAATSLRI